MENETLPFPLSRLSCGACGGKRVGQANSVTLYNRSFIELPSGFMRKRQYVEVEIVRFERSISEELATYNITAEFQVRCPKCRTSRLETGTLASIPLKLLRSVATCPGCWRPCEIVESRSSMERLDTDIDVVTFAGVITCPRCRSTTAVRHAASIHVGEHRSAYRSLTEGRRGSTSEDTGAQIEVFFSYSHKDRDLRDELEAHLSLLKNQGEISTWYDREIVPGAQWNQDIDHRLRSSGIILLLVSADFISSPYCYGVELRIALERHSEGAARVIPIILRPVDWHGSPLGELQALPTDGRPLTTWADRDEGLADIARGIRACVRDIRSKLAPS